MEYASGGELFDYIVSKRCLVEMEACKYFQQIISGIEYFHKLQIVHRDLKPENLLLDANRNLKIVDFGLSNIYEKNELLNTPCGSPCYAAPEMIAGKKYSGMMVDIWSAGIILYAMLCGYLPFDEENNDLLYKKIQIGDFKIPKNLSDKAKDFIRKILEVDPIKRYNIAQIKEHPWFHLNEYCYNEGIFINKHIIPVDENILISLKEYDFDINSARSNLLDNRHNHITSAYYLLLKKHLRKGNNSISDLESDLFREYINNPRNLLKNKDLFNDVYIYVYKGNRMKK
jgi:5'-AMP-activated protein kinase catalytic alpha subunit